MKIYDYLNIGSLVFCLLVILWAINLPVPLSASGETPTVMIATNLPTITPPPSLTPTLTVTPTVIITSTVTITPTTVPTLTHLTLPAGYRLIDQREDSRLLELTILMPANGTLATFKELTLNEKRMTRINLCSRIASLFQRIEYGDPVVCMMTLWYNVKDTD